MYYHKKQRKLNGNFSKKQIFYLSKNKTFCYHKHLQLQPHIEMQASPDLQHLQFLQLPLRHEHVKVKLSIVIGHFSCCHRG